MTEINLGLPHNEWHRVFRELYANQFVQDLQQLCIKYGHSLAWNLVVDS